MTIKERIIGALRGEMVLWINFTSCIHIEGPEAIRAHTLELLRQAYPGSHFLISITENVPDNVRKESFALPYPI